MFFPVREPLLIVCYYYYGSTPNSAEDLKLFVEAYDWLIDIEPYLLLFYPILNGFETTLGCCRTPATFLCAGLAPPVALWLAPCFRFYRSFRISIDVFLTCVIVYCLPVPSGILLMSPLLLLVTPPKNSLPVEFIVFWLC